MVTFEKLNKMYEALIDGKELTTQELYNCEFKQNDIKELIEKGTIERVKRGHYKYLDMEKFFCYGKRKIYLKEKDRAIECFKRCIELDPNYTSPYFRLFFNSIENKDYDSAFIYLDKFYDSENEFYNSDSKFYLYLLSNITKVPERYKEIVKNINFDDVKISPDDKRYQNVIESNRVRSHALMKSYVTALQSNSKIYKDSKRKNIQILLIKILLQQARECQIEYINKRSSLLESDKYEELIDLIENEKENHKIGDSDEALLFILNQIIEIKKTRIIPEPYPTTSKDIYELIYCKNFEKVYKLNMENLEKRGFNSSKSIINNALKIINNLITEIKTEEETKKRIIEEEKIKISDTYSDIINDLMNNNVNSALKNIEKYLKMIKKEEYEFLFTYLIKVSLLENDLAFTKPMIELVNLNKEDYKFNVSVYIEEFYKALSEKNEEKAKLFIDIISKSNERGYSNVNVDNLKTVFNKKEEIIIDEDILKSLEETKETIINDYVSISSNNVIAVQEEKVVTKPKKSIIKEKKYDIKQEEEFIKEKLKDVYEKGMVLLKPMDEDRMENIFKIVENISDVEAFTIGLDNKKQIVLKYTVLDYEPFDYGKTLKEIRIALKEKKFDECIEKYNKFLQMEHPKIWIYSYLGTIYRKKGDKNTALDFLKVATELAKESGNDKLDFTDIILFMEGKIDPENYKKRVKMQEEDFYLDLYVNYGIESANDIIELIDSGTNIIDACDKYYLSEEDKDIMHLIYARYCYSEERYQTGDKYLKVVEKSKNKTVFVKRLYEEVRINKKFYKNRTSYLEKTLINENSI